MKKIGIITFHSAYNYGSVLQAFATQEAVRRLGYEPEIINYRLQEQKYVYANLRFKYGVRELLKDLTLMPMFRKRSQKYEDFERFFKKYLNLTEEAETPEQVSSIWKRYTTVISGSDQIWNKHSLELEFIDWKFMKPYLLEDFQGKKISYASSVANMSDDELSKIKPALLQFDSIAMRESSSAEKISKLLGKNVEAVLDPTFLLNQNEWVQALDLKSERKTKDYILFYSLGGLKRFSTLKPILEAISKREKCPILILTPFCYTAKNANFVPHPEYGPCKFLNAVRDARMVITDSYHGTILSINFGKDVYSLCRNGGSEFRKTDILRLVGMEERIVTDPKQLLTHSFSKIAYSDVQKKIESLRQNSLSYLETSLRD